MRKTTKILFTLSVLLNLALIGTLGGRMYDDYKRHPWNKTKTDLSPESRNIVARNFRTTFRSMKEIHGQTEGVRKEMDRIMRAEDFDPEAFEVQAKKMDALKDKMDAIRMESMKDLARELPYEDRKKLADKMMRSFQPHRPGKHKHRMKSKGDWKPPQPESEPVPFPPAKPEEE